jgi:hypothetical protein
MHGRNVLCKNRDANYEPMSRNVLMQPMYRCTVTDSLIRPWHVLAKAGDFMSSDSFGARMSRFQYILTEYRQYCTSGTETNGRKKRMKLVNHKTDVIRMLLFYVVQSH